MEGWSDVVGIDEVDGVDDGFVDDEVRPKLVVGRCDLDGTFVVDGRSEGCVELDGTVEGTLLDTTDGLAESVGVVESDGSRDGWIELDGVVVMDGEEEGRKL